MLPAVLHDYCIAQLSCTLCELDEMTLRSSFCRCPARGFFSVFEALWVLLDFEFTPLFWVCQCVQASFLLLSFTSYFPLSYSFCTDVMNWMERRILGEGGRVVVVVESSTLPSLLHPCIPPPGVLQLAQLTQHNSHWKCLSWWTKSSDAGLGIRIGERRSWWCLKHRCCWVSAALRSTCPVGCQPVACQRPRGKWIATTKLQPGNCVGLRWHKLDVKK